MDYQEPSHLAAYPPGYDPRAQPHFQFYPPHQNPPLNPNPNPNPNPPFDHHYHSPFHYGVASLPPPIGPPSPAVGEPTYPVNHGGGYASQAAVYGGDYNGGCRGLLSYYHDPNRAANARFEDPRSVFFEDYRSNPVRYPNPTSNSVPTNTAQQFVATSYNHNVGSTRKIRHQWKISAKKSLKKTKIPQSVRCDVCKIVCDTKDVLKKHRLGKKHKQNLEKLKAVVAGETTTTTTATATATATTNSATPGPEAPDTCKSLNAQTKKKKASQKAEDLETKKQRVLEGGAAMDAVRTCSICKVVCNSETVFQYHLSGQKHAAMVKKEASGTATHSASTPAT